MPDAVVTDGVPELPLVTFILLVCLNQPGDPPRELLRMPYGQRGVYSARSSKVFC